MNTLTAYETALYSGLLGLPRGNEDVGDSERAGDFRRSPIGITGLGDSLILVYRHFCSSWSTF
jgi:hypothetical protein